MAHRRRTPRKKRNRRIPPSRNPRKRRCRLHMGIRGWLQGFVILGSGWLAGCEGRQSALDPAGEQGRDIFGLWSVFFWVTLGVYLLVVLVLLAAIFRSRKMQNEIPSAEPPLPEEPRQEKRTGNVIGALVGVTIVILFGLFLGDLLVGRSLHALSDPHPLGIKVTGHQWWWEVKYLSDVPSNIVTTANEIHVPVGKAVQLQLDSVDVIHSFWAPNFHGKKDLIPGHPTTFWFRATRAGTFRGQCAEFCGAQHAHMRFVIVADPADQFTNWLSSQAKPATQPTTDSQKHGQQVFLRTTCIMCHTIQGSGASATVGPNLTHVASRQMLAAGTLPNTRGHLGGWVLDAQHLKPGVRMPPNNLPADDFQALLDFLENLK